MTDELRAIAAKIMAETAAQFPPRVDKTAEEVIAEIKSMRKFAHSRYDFSLIELERLVAYVEQARQEGHHEERQRCLKDVLHAWPLEPLKNLREYFLCGTLSMADLQVQTVGAIKRQITEDITARDTAPDTSSRAAQKGDTQP